MPPAWAANLSHGSKPRRAALTGSATTADASVSRDRHVKRRPLPRCRRSFAGPPRGRTDRTPRDAVAVDQRSRGVELQQLLGAVRRSDAAWPLASKSTAWTRPLTLPPAKRIGRRHETVCCRRSRPEMFTSTAQSAGKARAATVSPRGVPSAPDATSSPRINGCFIAGMASATAKVAHAPVAAG